MYAKRLVILAVALALADPAVAQAPRKAAAGPPAKTDQKRITDSLEGPPLLFYLAKGEPDACGIGCNEWIAAEGVIDRAAGQRFRAFLQRLGKRKLPIYFDSPGGAHPSAIAIGRLLRQRDMTAGVARTIPQGCNPLAQRDEACAALKHSGRQLSADLRSARAMCASACVYALLGAKTRLIQSGARLGVHASTLARCDARGCVRLSSATKMTREQTSWIATDAVQLASYVREMGIDTALLDAARQIPHERIRFLSRDEIARFGIDRREFHESGWMVDEGPPGPFALLKFVTEAAGPDRKEYRTARIRLTCGRPDQEGGHRDARGLPRPAIPDIWLEYDRELASSDAGVTVPILLVARGGSITLRPRRQTPIVGYNDIPMDGRRARVPIGFLEEAANGDAIEIAEKPDPSQSEGRIRSTKISTAGLARSLAGLRSRCGLGVTL
jgi:hypothetical protein